MMRSLRTRLEAVARFPNLLAAAREAERGKRYRRDVLAFNAALEGRLFELQAELLSGRWRPQPHRHFHIRDPKPRWISAAPYKDRVVHHAICRQIAQPLERALIDDCWANRTGKGSHRAVLRLQQFCGRYQYALKVDIRRYFASIDQQILKNQLRKRIADPRLLALLCEIIDGGVVPEPHQHQFAGDDLVSHLTRSVGLPIGNLTSQLWANTYLGAFDHWVKETLHARGYLRFVDDFVLLHDDPDVVRQWQSQLTNKLATLRLLPHPRKTVIQPTSSGVSFLGYVVWPKRIRVRGATVRRFRRRLRHDSGPTKDQLAAWRGHTALAGGFRRRHFPLRGLS
ncbi:MAG: RNA-directed DNA polymerase [Pseudomonadota bacterium]